MTEYRIKTQAAADRWMADNILPAIPDNGYQGMHYSIGYGWVLCSHPDNGLTKRLEGPLPSPQFAYHLAGAHIASLRNLAANPVVEHTMKSWSYLFSALSDGSKTHDVRSTKDRDFSKGQMIKLCEWDNTTGMYTGNWLQATITHITSKDHVPCALSSAVLDDGYAILSLKVICFGKDG